MSLATLVTPSRLLPQGEKGERRGGTPMNFTYAANPCRVIFGPGSSATVGAELDRLGIAAPW